MFGSSMTTLIILNGEMNDIMNKILFLFFIYKFRKDKREFYVLIVRNLWYFILTNGRVFPGKMRENKVII